VFLLPRVPRSQPVTESSPHVVVICAGVQAPSHRRRGAVRSFGWGQLMTDVPCRDPHAVGVPHCGGPETHKRTPTPPHGG
jgi:hypothetical protein